MVALKVHPTKGLILLACLLCFAQAIFAQPGQKNTNRPDTTTKIDSATISRNLTKLAKDSVNKIRKSDTTVAVLINRIEGYTLMLNQTMSVLKRGFDTTRISASIPLTDSSLPLIKRNIATLGRTPNIHDVYTN